MGVRLRLLITEFRRLSGEALVRPLRAWELGLAVGVTILVGTLYCALYCRLAMQPMHAGAMPIKLSAWWAASALLPWLLAFEASKRVLPKIQWRVGKFLFFVSLCLATLALTIAAQQCADFTMNGMMSDNVRMVAANQLQPLLIFMILTGLWMGRPPISAERSSANGHGEDLPALDCVDWIRGAGNYVELSCGDRLLIRRMTMAAAERATANAGFVRVHRSMIVRASLIAGLPSGERRRLLLKTGETVPVGDSYRRGLGRLVTSSPPFDPSAHLAS